MIVKNKFTRLKRFLFFFFLADEERDLSETNTVGILKLTYLLMCEIDEILVKLLYFNLSE